MTENRKNSRTETSPGNEQVFSSNPTRKRNHTLPTPLYILGGIAAIIVLIVVLHANLMFSWQNSADRNKEVIVEYAAEHYPGAKAFEWHYNTANFFAWNNSVTVVFSLDGVEFRITAKGGKILTDDYPEAQAN